MKQKQIARGLRNNNPLNIRRSEKIHWLGAPAEQPDAEFVTFKSMAYGYRAAWKLLGNYKLRFLKEGKPFTVRNILNRWAPPSDGNDTLAYIRAVCLHARISADEVVRHPVFYPEDSTLMLIIEAMTMVECGIKADEVDREAILKGFELMKSR